MAKNIEPLTNTQVQSAVSIALDEVMTAELTPTERSLCVSRLTRAHVLCTRATVYASRLTHQVDVSGKPLTNIAATLKMPVFKR